MKKIVWKNVAVLNLLILICSIFAFSLSLNPEFYSQNRDIDVKIVNEDAQVIEGVSEKVTEVKNITQIGAYVVTSAPDYIAHSVLVEGKIYSNINRKTISATDISTPGNMNTIGGISFDGGVDIVKADESGIYVTYGYSRNMSKIDLSLGKSSVIGPTINPHTLTYQSLGKMGNELVALIFSDHWSGTSMTFAFDKGGWFNISKSSAYRSPDWPAYGISNSIGDKVYSISGDKKKIMAFRKVGGGDDASVVESGRIDLSGRNILANMMHINEGNIYVAGYNLNIGKSVIIVLSADLNIIQEIDVDGGIYSIYGYGNYVVISKNRNLGGGQQKTEIEVYDIGKKELIAKGDGLASNIFFYNGYIIGVDGIAVNVYEFMNMSGVCEDKDKDGYPKMKGDMSLCNVKQIDCNDDFDNANIDKDYSCSSGFETFKGKAKGEREGFCNKDENNNGIGDYASCGYCINPGMKEVADNVDNDCKGHSQAKPEFTCNLYEEGVAFTGDGGNANKFYDENGNDVPIYTLASPYGGEDKFCQMVDDNVDIGGVVCGGYSRAVKWIDYTNSGTMTNYVFKPGGVSGDAECGVFSLLDVIGSFESLACNAKKESEGKTRGTGGDDYPKQFIDSVYGELNIDIFIKAFPSIKDSGAVWRTTCVAKDKCADGVDNDWERDLLITAPYSSYIGSLKEYIYSGEESQIDSTAGTGTRSFNVFKNKVLNSEFEEEFNVKLVDHDDPECKFKEGHGGQVGYPRYSWPTEYKERPYASTSFNPQNTYCYDEDGDGFCRNSNIYPDCDDEPGKIDYQTRSFELDVHGFNKFVPIKATKEMGWETDVGVYTSWHVHPFPPVAYPYSCNKGKYGANDFNCNKDGAAGYAFEGLRSGDTPFDNYLGTGQERTDISGADSACLVGELPKKMYDENGFSISSGFGSDPGAFSNYFTVAKTLVYFIPYMGAVFAFAEDAEVFEDIHSTLWDRKSSTLAKTGYVIFGLFLVGTYAVAGGSVGKGVKRIDKVGCFLEDTKIVMADGMRKDIEDVEIGDLVKAYDIENDVAVNASVTYTFVRNETKYRIIKYEWVD